MRGREREREGFTPVAVTGSIMGDPRSTSVPSSVPSLDLLLSILVSTVAAMVVYWTSGM